MDFIGSQAQVFSQNIKISQKIEAPLLGLAKSIFYQQKHTMEKNTFQFGIKRCLIGFQNPKFEGTAVRDHKVDLVIKFILWQLFQPFSTGY